MSVVDINTMSLAGNWGNGWVITNNEEYLEIIIVQTIRNELFFFFFVDPKRLKSGRAL